MKTVAISFILLLSVCFSSQAAPPTDQAIEQMMNVMQVEKMLNQMLAQMDTGMRTGMEQGLQQSLHGSPPTPPQEAKIAEIEAKFVATMKDELSYAKLKDIYLQVYRETFTADEVNAIIAFYGTPAGKAVVEKVPIAMQKAGTLMQSRLGPITQKMQATLEQAAKDLEKTK